MLYEIEVALYHPGVPLDITRYVTKKIPHRISVYEKSEDHIYLFWVILDCVKNAKFYFPADSIYDMKIFQLFDDGIRKALEYEVKGYEIILK